MRRLKVENTHQPRRGECDGDDQEARDGAEAEMHVDKVSARRRPRSRVGAQN